MGSQKRKELRLWAVMIWLNRRCCLDCWPCIWSWLQSSYSSSPDGCSNRQWWWKRNFDASKYMGCSVFICFHTQLFCDYNQVYNSLNVSHLTWTNMPLRVRGGLNADFSVISGINFALLCIGIQFEYHILLYFGWDFSLLKSRWTRMRSRYLDLFTMSHKCVYFYGYLIRD